MSTPQALRAVRNDNQQAAAKPANNFPAMLESYKCEIAKALPKHLSADRMARIALTAFRMTPKLADCDPRSVFAAVIQSSQMGLEVGLSGEAHLVPFGNQCQLIPGYTGLMKLARNGGNVIDIYAHEVREHDVFSLTYGLERTLRHEPLTQDGGFPASEEMRGKITGFYAVAVYKDGNRTFVAMGRAEVEKTRDESKGYQAAKKYKKESVWDTNFPAMGLKTTIRRICKFLPKSAELAAALSLDATHEQGKGQNIDLDQAIEGVFVPVPEGEVDKESGEIIASQQQQQEQQRQPASTAAQAQQTGAPKVEAVPAAAQQQGKSPLEKAIQTLEEAQNVEALDELYIRLETSCADADLESLLQAYRIVKAKIENAETSLF